MSATGMPRRHPSRRSLLDRGRPRAVGLAAGVLALVFCGAAAPHQGVGLAYFPLDSATVAVATHGERVRIGDPVELVPGTRVRVGTTDSRTQAREQRRWLAAGTVPPVPTAPASTMVRDALLDLHVLSGSAGAPVAGWAPAWRYVWPRDAALVATALARTGHVVDAERVLTFLQSVQPAGGVFQARYLPDGSGVPDDRGTQSDSVGWALWALNEVAAQVPRADRRALVARHRPLLERSAAACLSLVDNSRSLPAPSPDYWETPEARLTLATAALVEAGLSAAATLYDTLGESRPAAESARAATRTGDAIRRSFAADGYPRTAGGSAATVDLGVSFLLPPFARTVDSSALVAWRNSAAVLARPGGGVAPGGSWRRDGVSWTTATSSRALTAAFVGDRAEAVRRLRWLDAHRTAAGSIPEKVLADGRPASVAPLAWAAAAVVIAADELDRRTR